MYTFIKNYKDDRRGREGVSFRYTCIAVKVSIICWLIDMLFCERELVFEGGLPPGGYLFILY